MKAVPLLPLMNKAQMREFVAPYNFRINYGKEGVSVCFDKKEVIRVYKLFKDKRKFIKIERRTENGTWVPMKFAKKA